MQLRALHSSSSPIHTKFPTPTEQNSTFPPPLNINLYHPQIKIQSTPPIFCISDKFHCISANVTPEFELELLDPESETTIGTQNGNYLASQMQEITVTDEVISSEMVETRSGSLANQGLWEQIVEIVKFSGPATGIWVCGPLMSLIDTAVIGQGSSIELAALGPGTVLCDYLGFVFMFLSVATSNMVATSLTRKDEDQVQHLISMLIFIGLACGTAMIVLTKLFGPWALNAFVGAKNAHLIPAANTYIQIRALSWPAVLIGSIAQSASLGMKDSFGPLKALLIASTINVIGHIILCIYLGYGIAGAACATATSQVIAAYAMVQSLNNKGYNGFSLLIPSLAELQEVISIAAPVFLTMISKVGFYALMIYFATSMGTITVAAHQILAQIFGICSVWGEPLSQTAQSFMPELLFGIDKSIVKARALLRSLLIIGAVIGLVLGAVATSVPWLFPNVFTPDAAVIAETHRVWIHFFLALCITPCTLPCEGTLLAGRDLKFISLSMTACFLLCALSLQVMANQGLGIVSCWTALVGFQWARFFMSFRRLLSPNGLLYSAEPDNFWFSKLKAA